MKNNSIASGFGLYGRILPIYIFVISAFANTIHWKYCHIGMLMHRSSCSYSSIFVDLCFAINQILKCSNSKEFLFLHLLLFLPALCFNLLLLAGLVLSHLVSFIVFFS